MSQRPLNEHFPVTRRAALAAGAAATAGLLLPGRAKATTAATVPSYLASQADLYATSPREAAKQWFAESNFGLFLHYGLYSLLGKGEWVQLHDRIRLNEYEKLADQFDAAEFDADRITDMALDAGMKYVTITARHHDSFCLFDSAVSDFSTVQTAAKRDLIAEMAEACAKKGVGLFIYYSYACDWRHPNFMSRDHFRFGRPAYDPPEPRFVYKQDSDFKPYVEFIHAQIRELLTNYGPIAGLWFDPVIGYYSRPDLFPIEESYAMIRELQPQTLITFKQGANGDEDFAAPEREGASIEEKVRKRLGDEKAAIAAAAWAKNKHKHNEICDTMQPRHWGYAKEADGNHLGSDTVLARLNTAMSENCNLLMNSGPLPGGAIHAEDTRAYSEVGAEIRQNGYPA